MTAPALPMPRFTQPQIIRFLILGLPSGLIITGVIAMFVYFRLDKKRTEIESRILVSKAVNEADLRASVHTLSAAIGPRTTAVPETVSSARKYIQSTLGPANLGYQVSRVEFEKEGQPWHHLVIDLPGKNDTLRDEVVIVTANYDTPANSPGADGNASGIAGLMSLAQSFAGASTDRSLRFVATVHDAPPFAGTDNTGSASYSATLRERKEKIAAIVSLEGLGCFSDETGSQKIPATPASPYPDKADFLAIISNPAAETPAALVRQRLEKHPALPLEFEASPAAGPLLGNAAAWAFDRAAFPVIRVTDTAELRNPHWQQPTDTAETLDYPRFLKAVETVEKIISALVNPNR